MVEERRSLFVGLELDARQTVADVPVSTPALDAHATFSRSIEFFETLDELAEIHRSFPTEVSEHFFRHRVEIPIADRLPHGHDFEEEGGEDLDESVNGISLKGDRRSPKDFSLHPC